MGKNSEPADGTLEYANQEYNKIFGDLSTFYGQAHNAVDNGRNQFVADVYPFVDAAKNSMSEIQQFLGLATTDGSNKPALTWDQITQKLQDTPGYKFTVDQGNQALQRTAAAGGMLSSGNALVAAQQYGQQLGNTTYQSHLTNLMNFNNSQQPMVAANLANIQDNASLNAQLFANQGNQVQAALTQKGNSNTAAAMQNASIAAQANSQAQVSNGALAGLQAGYLRGAF